MTRKFASGVAAGISAVALAAAGLFPALAVADDATDKATDISSISNEPTPGKLHVHKMTPSSTEQKPGNGTELTPPPTDSKPINKVKFTVKQVENVNLKTNAGWKEAEAIMAGYKPNSEMTMVTKDGGQPASYNLIEAKEARTAGQGVADFTGLKVGLYLVYETLDQDVTIDGDTVSKDRITKAAPFYVTIPMTNPQNRDAWMYDIHVYPKNNLSTVPTKTVNDDEKGVASGAEDADKSIITYTLSAVVPKVNKLEAFDLIDKYPGDKLKWLGGATDVVKIGANTVLSAGTDYTFTQKESGNDKFVAVTMTDTGLEKLLAHKGETLGWTFHGRVLTQTDPVKIPNEPYLNENPGVDGWTTQKPGTPGPGVTSYYGKVKLTKKDEKNGNLKGAKFALYECSEQGFTDGSKNIPAGWALDEANRVKVNDKTEWISAETTGLIEISDLLVNDFRNNSTLIDPNGSDTDPNNKWVTKSWYCLKEIQAPDGYELLPNPIKFQVLSSGGTTLPTQLDLEVHNNKTPNLPVTGGAGIAALVAGGVLLIGGSGIYAFAASRKRKQS